MTPEALDYCEKQIKLVEDLRAQIVTLQSDNERLTKERNMLKNKIKESGRYKLREQLAASQAREAKLREALKCTNVNLYKGMSRSIQALQARTNAEALALPSDTTALDERLAQERERICELPQIKGNMFAVDAIRSMK